MATWSGEALRPSGPIDGTVVPSAAGGSLPFCRKPTLRVLKNIRNRYGAAWSKYGFVNAFNPLTNWYDTDVIGIDTGITMLMAENLRTGFVWDTFMKTPEAQRGMQRAGFRSTEPRDAVKTACGGPTSVWQSCHPRTRCNEAIFQCIFGDSQSLELARRLCVLPGQTPASCRIRLATNRSLAPMAGSAKLLERLAGAPLRAPQCACRPAYCLGVGADGRRSGRDLPRVVAAACPSPCLWITKLIIDGIVHAVTTHQPVPDRLWWLVAAEFGLAVFGQHSESRAIDYLDSLARRQLHPARQHPGHEARGRA